MRIFNFKESAIPVCIYEERDIRCKRIFEQTESNSNKKKIMILRNKNENENKNNQQTYNTKD